MAHYGIAPVIFESVSNVTATNSVDLGTRVRVGAREFVYVYNGSDTQISIGEGAIMQTGTSGFTVCVSSVTNVDYFAGVVYHTTMTTNTYGWLLVRGACKYKMVANSVATASDLLCAGANGRFTAANLTGTSIVGFPVQAKASIATASAGIGEGYIIGLLG